jgi:N-acyl homoserine lactone hydrolase
MPQATVGLRPLGEIFWRCTDSQGRANHAADCRREMRRVLTRRHVIGRRGVARVGRRRSERSRAAAPHRYDVLVAGNSLCLRQGYLGISSIVLVEAGRTRILLDCGHHVTRPALREALRVRGLGPDDIDLLVLSHLHFDDALNVDLFARSRVLVSQAEWAYAQAPHPDDDFVPAGITHLVGGPDLELVESEAELAPGVTLFPAPGHTPGCVALRLDGTWHGTVVLAAGAIKHVREAVTGEAEHAFTPPGVAAATIGRIVETADRIVPGHFPELIRIGERRFTWTEPASLDLVIR